MPREIVHWNVLESVQERLAPNSCVLQNLKQHRAAAYVGALAHDAPYYYQYGRENLFVRVAEVLHGTHGADTFDPIRQLADHIVQERDSSEETLLWAFLFGMVTHCATDIHFHPMVYYFTGNYYADNIEERIRVQGRHRLFEVHLDSWFRGRRFFWNKGYLSQGLKELSNDLSKICRLLAGVSTLQVSADASLQLSDCWQQGIQQMSFLQGLFLSTPIGAFLRLLRVLGKGRFTTIDSLFSFGRRHPLEFFDQPFQYKNPVTGIEETVTVIQLKDRAVNDAVKWLSAFEPLVGKATKDVQTVLGHIQGNSLNVGLYQVTVDKYHYFSEQGVDLPGLVIR